MRKLSENRKGVISTYFTALFLYVISLCLLIAANDMHRIETISNMKQYAKEYCAVSEVIASLKNRLYQRELESGTYSTSSCTYQVEAEDQILYISISSPSLFLHVYYDPDTYRILDYSRH